jgi:membrane protein required for colicin V production
MIWIDFTGIGLVLISFVIGFSRGFIKEIFSLVFWMLAIWVSLRFSRELSVFLEPTISHRPARVAASFLALFAITLILGGLIRWVLSLLSKKNAGLTIMDRFGGMVFGVVRGVFLVTVVVILAGLTPLRKDSWWTESTLIPPFQLLAVGLQDHSSSGMAQHISYR